MHLVKVHSRQWINFSAYYDWNEKQKQSFHVNPNCTFIRIYDDSFQGEMYAETKATTTATKKNNINNSGNQKAYKNSQQLTKKSTEFCHDIIAFNKLPKHIYI